MSTDNHSAISSGAAANAATFNTPMGQLDAAIGNLAGLTTTAKGSVVLAMNEVDGHADTNLASIGTIGNLLTASTNLTAAVNEVWKKANYDGLLYFAPLNLVWNATTKILSSTTSNFYIFFGNETASHIVWGENISIDFSAVAGTSVWAYAYLVVTWANGTTTVNNSDLHIESQNALTHDMRDRDVVVIATYGQTAGGIECVYSPFSEFRNTWNAIRSGGVPVTPDYRNVIAPNVQFDPTTKILSADANTRIYAGQDATSYVTITDAVSIDFSALTDVSSTYYAYISGVNPSLAAPQNFTNSQIVVERHTALTRNLTDGDIIVLAKYSITPGGHVTLESELFKGDLFMDYARGQFTLPKGRPWHNLYPNLTAKLPLTRALLLGHASDATITLWGDSIFAREDHTSVDGIDVTAMPPMVLSKNLGYYLWVKGPQYNRATYRRYDYTSFFTYSGAWTEAEHEANWNSDEDTRPAWTYYSAAASADVTFTVAGDSDKTGFALIYRTDTAGDAAAAVGITGGDGRIEAWNGSSWVEANGYTIDMSETDAGANEGNTIYQKRQKFRKTAGYVSTAITVTISKDSADSDRLLLWGIEMYDKDKPILRLINAARGGYAIGQLDDVINDDVYTNTPNLVIFEIPLINEIIDDPDPARIVNAVQDAIYGDRGGATNTWALLQHAETADSGTWDTFEALIVIPPYIQAHFNADGSWATLSSGYTARDIYGRVKNYVIGRGDVGVIDLGAAQLREIDADMEYANYYTACASSGTDGRTYTEDDVHPNDRAVQAMASHLVPPLDFNT